LSARFVQAGARALTDHLALEFGEGAREFKSLARRSRQSSIFRNIERTRHQDINHPGIRYEPRIFGPQLRASSFAGQKTEATIGVTILNRMHEAGRPNSVRSFKKTAWSSR
jgi:hypothetical protein